MYVGYIGLIFFRVVRMESLRGTCEPPSENTLGLDAAGTVRVPTCRSLCFMWFPGCILSVLAGVACDVSQTLNLGNCPPLVAVG